MLKLMERNIDSKLMFYKITGKIPSASKEFWNNQIVSRSKVYPGLCALLLFEQENRKLSTVVAKK